MKLVKIKRTSKAANGEANFLKFNKKVGNTVSCAIIRAGLRTLRVNNNCLVEEMKKEAKKLSTELFNTKITPSVISLLTDNKIDVLMNSSEDMKKKKGITKNYLDKCEGSLERALIISLYVISQSPKGLLEAFRIVEELKISDIGDNGDFGSQGATLTFSRLPSEDVGGSESDNDSEFDVDDSFFGISEEKANEICAFVKCNNQSDVRQNIHENDEIAFGKIVFPLIGLFTGLKNQVQGNGNDEFADLAEVESDCQEQFNENFKEFCRGIELVERKKRLFLNFSDKYINRKTVGLLAVTLGFLCWWYKSFFFKNISVNSIT